MINADRIYGIIAILIPLVELLGILTAVHAVMNARTSQGAIAWAISLVTFPWLALALYAIFGRNKFNGYVLLRSSKDLDIHHIVDKIQAEASAKKLIREELSESERALTRLADMPITRYNKSRLLKLAALRGVDVRILLPEKADHRTVYLASFSYYTNTLTNTFRQPQLSDREINLWLSRYLHLTTSNAFGMVNGILLGAQILRFFLNLTSGDFPISR